MSTLREAAQALRLADWFEGGYGGCELEAAAELRRLHDIEKTYESACKIIDEQDKKLAELEAVNAELLAALKVMLYMTERHVLLPGATPAPESPVALARAAIAKAEGQK